MNRVADVLKAIEKLAPPHYAFDFDKVGLQIGDPKAPVTKITFSLDSSLAAAQYATQTRSQLLVSHHPLLFHPLTHLRPGSHVQNTTIELIKNNVAFIAAHTNWDCAPGGINDTLAQTIGLTGITPIGSSNLHSECKIVAFVPANPLQTIIDALSKAGAGQIGAYSRCAFYQEGTGTFIGDDTTNPAVGRKNTIETTHEVRLEMIVPQNKVNQVTKALINTHPYEEPAYDIYPLHPTPAHPICRIGTLPEPQSPNAFQEFVDTKLQSRSEMWLPDNLGPIERVAVGGGNAASDWKHAQRAGAQVLLTGECAQHIALEASEAGIAVIAAGHYATEQPGVVRLAHDIRTALSIDITVFEPEPGHNGRPI